jgi:hypothetical protein
LVAVEVNTKGAAVVEILRMGEAGEVVTARYKETMKEV